jgi:hypothetical protein
MNKKFDSVEFMRKRRVEIEHEDAGLSWDEKSAKTQAVIKGDPLWEKLRRAGSIYPSPGAAPGNLRVAEDEGKKS